MSAPRRYISPVQFAKADLRTIRSELTRGTWPPSEYNPRRKMLLAIVAKIDEALTTAPQIPQHPHHSPEET